MEAKETTMSHKDFCSTCPKKDTCKEICQPLETYLRTTRSDKELLGIKRSASDRQIQRKQVYHDPNTLEWLAGERAMRISLGMTDRSDMSVTDGGDE